jgi:hypothetical protein
MTSLSPTERALRSARRPDERAPDGEGSDALFPLPLTPFEHLFLLDDYPAYPAHFFCRFRFSGRLQQQSLNEALGLALARHPLLAAVVQDVDARGPCWLACRNSPRVQWMEQEPTLALPRAGILDIRVRPGLHVAAVVGSNQSDLVLQFHHAACDGVGALDFATDLLTAYANTLAGATRYRFKPLDPSRLRDRAALPLSGRKLFMWGVRRLPNLRTLWRFFRRQPAPVIPHRPQFDAAGPPPAYPEAYFHHFTSEESAALAEAARSSEVSLNSLLTRDLFLALARWRQQDGLSDSAWLRLMMPINMRSPSDRCLPAANVVSTIFLDCRLSDELDAGALLHGVNRVMEDVKRHNLGLAWLLALRVLQFMPRAWARVRGSRRRCLTSALLTNFGPVLAASPLPRVGRLLIVGNMILEQVEIVPAARPLQCLAFAVNTYAGRMSVGMRYHSQVFTPERGKEAFDVYLDTLRASMGFSPGCSNSSTSGSSVPTN